MKGLDVSDACEDRLSTAPDLLKQAGIDSDCTRHRDHRNRDLLVRPSNYSQEPPIPSNKEMPMCSIMPANISAYITSTTRAPSTADWTQEPIADTRSWTN
jgi:hypothetical protein